VPIPLSVKCVTKHLTIETDVVYRVDGTALSLDLNGTEEDHDCPSEELNSVVVERISSQMALQCRRLEELCGATSSGIDALWSGSFRRNTFCPSPS
jgi:hypothetical protein